jgi:hypothetical protein
MAARAMTRCPPTIAPHRSPAPEPFVRVAESSPGDSGGSGLQATSSRWTETAYCTDGDQDHSTEDQQGRIVPPEGRKTEGRWVLRRPPGRVTTPGAQDMGSIGVRYAFYLDMLIGLPSALVGTHHLAVQDSTCARSMAPMRGSWPPTRGHVSPAASIPITKTLASLLQRDGAGMSCGRGLGVRRRPTRRTSSHPRMHGRAGARRRAGRLPPGRWTPGDLCCGAYCWKPRRPRVSTHRSTFPATCPRAAVIGGSMGPERPRTTAN